MDALNRLLERLKRSLDGDRVFKEEIRSSIKDVAGFDVPIEDISTQGNILKIKTSPAKRNELKFKEDKVLETVRARTKVNLTKLLY